MVSRIKQLLDWQQLSPTQFADRIGVGRPVMSHILSERNKPSLEVVQRIIAAFPSVSLPWLLSGAGEMLASAVAPGTEPTSPAAFAPPVAVALPLPAPAAIAAPAKDVAQVMTPPNKPSSAPAASRPAPARFAAARAAAAPASVTAATAGRFVAPGPGAAPSAPAPLADMPLVDVPAAALPAAAAGSRPVPELMIAEPTQPIAPVAAPTSTSTPTPAPSSAQKLTQALAGGLGLPGKAIRRIVIFYSDGSFADYQPEN